MDILSNIFAAKRFPTTIGGITSTSTSTTGGSAISSIGYGEVGTYVIAYFSVSTQTTVLAGATYAGTSLIYINPGNGQTTGLNLWNDGSFNRSIYMATTTASPISIGSGTWRLMTNTINATSFTYYIAGLFVRIA